MTENTPLKIDTRAITNNTSNEYIAWIDIMGTQSIMSRSMSMSANFIIKFQTYAANIAKESVNVRIYPVMDGIYLTTKSKGEFVGFCRNFFKSCAELFCDEGTPIHRFIVRGAVAYGPIIHGSNIDGHDLQSILLGIPMIQAYTSERLAPPFGMYVHESARAFASTGDEPFKDVWFSWNTKETKTLWVKTYDVLAEYFAYCESNSSRMLYPVDGLTNHKKLSKEYFGNLSIPKKNSAYKQKNGFHKKPRKASVSK